MDTKSPMSRQLLKNKVFLNNLPDGGQFSVILRMTEILKDIFQKRDKERYV